MKMSPSQMKLYEEIDEKYGEWLESGYPLNGILLSLLQQEREKNIYLEKRLDSVQYAKKNLD